MPAMPWMSSTTADPTRDYLVLASELPLRRLSSTPAFMRMVLQVRRQLSGARGLIGYTLDARPLARRYWTLSAWEDRDALYQFVAARPHSAVMTRRWADVRHPARGGRRAPVLSASRCRLPISDGFDDLVGERSLAVFVWTGGSKTPTSGEGSLRARPKLDLEGDVDGQDRST